MNPYVIILIAVAAFASGWEVNGWRLKSDYEAEAAATWKAAKQETDRRVAEVRKQEADSRRTLAQIGSDLQTNLTQREKDLEKARRDIRAGFDRVFGSANCTAATTLPDAAGAGRGDDGSGGSKLSDSFAGFFGAEAKRANGIVDKLTACQRTVAAYLKTCNKPPEGG